MDVVQRRPNIDELEADRDKLVAVIRDLLTADRSTLLMRKEQAKALLCELGYQKEKS